MAGEIPDFRDMDEEASTPVVLPAKETDSYQVVGEPFRRDHRGVPILEARSRGVVVTESSAPAIVVESIHPATDEVADGWTPYGPILPEDPSNRDRLV